MYYIMVPVLSLYRDPAGLWPSSNISSGARHMGVLPDALITVVDVRWYGAAAIELTFKDRARKPQQTNLTNESMERTLRLALNLFPEVPRSLRQTPNSEVAVDSIKINLANLYHHYYLDTYGRVPPDPDPTNFEYLKFLAPSADFRWRGNGLGFGSAARRHRSNEVGQAFCRMFLHDHLGIYHFAHMEHMLDRNAQDPFSHIGSAHRRRNTPDYF